MFFTKFQIGVSQRVFIPSRAWKCMLEGKCSTFNKCWNFLSFLVYLVYLNQKWQNSNFLAKIADFLVKIACQKFQKFWCEVAQLQIFFNFLLIWRNCFQLTFTISRECENSLKYRLGKKSISFWAHFGHFLKKPHFLSKKWPKKEF